ncbi:cytochrome P450 4A10 [Colletotrichum karsti]|uniref:Cytochrome P450 4A10 n=1 Tax=Colletotrichum karsti TaxID=1095194 RepID=A0A9P6LG39_9PEZI|nr:cytochrome P450 4A10 [Colletotrichum karsti]KAF9871786.1 cytochrome P450 4A10 [Colletotrichum karsti]
MDLLRPTGSHIAKRSNNPWVKPAYHYEAFRSSPAYSIFTELDPGTHTAHSRLLTPAFSQTRVTAPDAQQLVWDRCNAMVQGMRKYLAADQRREDAYSESTTVTVGLNTAFRSFALDVVTTWTFGHCADSLSSFHSELFEIFDSAAESVTYYTRKSLEENRAALNGAGEVVPCVFSELISSRWQEKRSYTPSDGQIISDGIVILAAGADTTAAALSIGIHWLARNPDLWQQLQDELRPVMETEEASPRIEALAQLPLLNAVLKEGLRVSCPIRGHMPRVVPAKGWNYNGTHFPAGTVVATSAFYGCYNATVFPNPERYDPTRWLPPKHTAKMEAHLQPFSRGTRQCIGQNLTLAMQRVAIASVVYNFQPVAVDSTEIKTRERILCLHGDGTNAMVFAAQTRHLRRALESHGIELIYATGPFECDPGYGVSPFFDDCGPFYRWCPNDPRDVQGRDFTTEEDDLAESAAMAAGIIDMFEDLRYEFGHDDADGENGRDGFVGILGFSSAAAVVAGILAVQDNSVEDLCPAWYRFRFGVLINGTGPPARFPTIGGDAGKQPIEVPTLSVVGKQDQWQSQSRLLNTSFDRDLLTCLEFDNGHKIPSEDGQVQKMVSVILDMVRKTDQCIQVS